MGLALDDPYLTIDRLLSHIPFLFIQNKPQALRSSVIDCNDDCYGEPLLIVHAMPSHVNFRNSVKPPER